MGAWTLTVIGEDTPSDLGPAFNNLVADLNAVGHRVITLRIRTDAGEHSIDLPPVVTAVPVPVIDPTPAVVAPTPADSVPATPLA